MTLKQELDRDVNFGVYDLVSRRVGVPRLGNDKIFGLCDPSPDLPAARELGMAVAGSNYIKSFLDAAP